ncbi:MAG: AAA family ATPase [bacterium]|nr:AAA family ATPase [bacterium]
MGIYLNPGNSGFQEIRNSRYVDKSGMISLINQVIGTKQKLVCVSRPRRFGKSFAAQMLCAYYDRSCDSSALFEDLAIATDHNLNGSYRQHLNRYDVIYLDMTYFKPFSENYKNLNAYISRKITEELLAAYPALTASNELPATMCRAVELTGHKFIMIIDEWDAPIRETPELQKEYLHFLLMLFKSSGTTDKIFAAAYMTGILPIKKDGSQSAISDFEEFSMLSPGKFSRYIGFTEDEVRQLCQETGCDFAMMKHWYDGYTFPGVGSVYNSNSVMKAIRNENFESYWTQTSAADSLLGYISLDFDGLSGVVAELVGGGKTKVNTKKFSNDLVTFHSRDDVLTLLIHLGYLTYDEKTHLAWIPNEEIRIEFDNSVRDVKRDETIRRVRESDQLIADTVHGNADAVAAQIEKIHAEEAPLHYNNEQALRSVLKRAYFSYGDEYVLFEELPAGAGFADIVYLPKKDSLLPALLIELKWNHSAESAIAQIRDKHYPEALKSYSGNLLLVAVAYDKDAPAGKRKHTCIIEQG